jgi:TetR/AcrR family transcriptional repressor of bet genes
MPRPTNTDERQAQIIAGLQQVMALKGYERASIQDIAKAARLSPGLVHYHFDSKLEVLEALVATLRQRHLARLDDALAAAGHDPLDRVFAFVDFHLAAGPAADPESLAVWVSLSGEALRSTEVRERFSAALGELRDRLLLMIAEGQRKKLFVKGDAQALAVALLATIEGYFVIAATARELIPAGSAARAARRMAEGLLSPGRSS